MSTESWTPIDQWLPARIFSYGPGVVGRGFGGEFDPNQNIGYSPTVGWNAFEAAGEPGGNYNSWLTNQAMQFLGTNVNDWAKQQGLTYNPQTQSVRGMSFDDEDSGLGGFWTGPLSVAGALAGLGAASAAGGAGGGLTSAAGTGLEAAEAAAGGSMSGMTWDSTIGQMVDQWGNVVDQSAMPGTTPGYTSPTGITPGYSGEGFNMPSIPPGMQQLLQQLMGQGQGGGGGAPGGAQGGGFNLGSLLHFLGIGSGLNTLLNPGKPAVDPAMVQALWQAGQQTYNAGLDPQQALYNRSAQQMQDQVRAGESARGITMSPYGAGVEGKAMGDFNIDWQNSQLARQLSGLQGFAGAGNVAANAGIANNAQAFMQNQTGLNNLTTGAGQLFGTTGGTPGLAGAAAGGAAGAMNPIGAWINSLFSGGGQQAPAGGGYNTFDPNSSYNSQGTFQPYYGGYDIAGGPAYG